MKGKFLKKSTVILFLNKLDIFTRKIGQGNTIKQHFPKYSGVCQPGVIFPSSSSSSLSPLSLPLPSALSS